MKKMRTALVAAAVGAISFLLPVASASASPAHHTTVAPAQTQGEDSEITWFDQIYSLRHQQDIFIAGGRHVGQGAAEVVSAGVLGLGMAILDIPAHLLGVPKPLGYV